MLNQQNALFFENQTYYKYKYCFYHPKSIFLPKLFTMEVLTQKSYIVGIHKNAFRAGEPAEIIDLKFAKPSPQHEWRLAFEVEYFDGKRDYIGYSDVIAGNYVIISDADLANERIPKVSR